MGNLAPRAFAVIACFPLMSCLYAQRQDTAGASLDRARQSISQRDFREAESLLRTALEQSPESADAHFLLAVVLFHEQRPSDSLAEYTIGARFRNPGLDELLGVASDYILLKDYTDADHWLATATQVAPQSARAWYLLGRTKYNQNQLEDAERSFLTCLRIDAHDVKSEYNLGLVYEKSGRPKEAREAYEKAIKWQESVSTKDPQPFLDLGMLLRQQGQAEEALPYLLVAEKAGSRNPLAHAEAAQAYEQLNRFDEAISALKQALALAPNSQALHFFLGRVYRRAGRDAEAKGEFAQAAKLARANSYDGVPNEDVNP